MQLNRYVINIGLFFISSVVAKAVGALLSLVLAKSLQPANLGIWITMTLFVSYTSILSLGTIETLLKMYPFHKGRGDLEVAQKVENVVFTAIFIASVLVLLIGYTVPNLISTIEVGQLSVEIRIMAIAATLSFFSAFFYYRLLAHQNFKIAAIIEGGRAVLNIMFIGTFAWVWSLWGAALGFCLTELILCVVSAHMSNRRHERIRLLLDLRAIWTSIVIGFPITAFWWIFMVQGSVDRMMTMFFLGKESTGYYGLGVSIASVLALLPGSLSRVLYPRISEKLGADGGEKEIFRLVVIPTRFLTLIISVVIGPMVIALPLVYHMLPKYLPGLESAQFLMLFIFLGLSISNGVNFLIAANKQISLCLYVVASLIIGSLATYLAIILGFGIEGVAISRAIPGLLLVLLVWRAVFRSMGLTFYGQLYEMTQIYAPCLLMLLHLGLGHQFFPTLFLQTSITSICFYIFVFMLIFSCTLIVIPMTRKSATEMIHVILGAPK